MNETPTSEYDVRELVEPLYRGKFWMQLIGVMLIISGVLTALTVIGIVIAWIPIWAGVVLMQSAGSMGRAFERNDVLEFKHGIGRLRTHFTIMGVFLLIYIIVMALAMLFGLGAGIMGVGEMQGMHGP